MPEVLPSLFAHRFDVILLSPPADTPFGELQALELSRLASAPGFVWLWVGSGVRGDGIGLEKGRELLASWGYRCARLLLSLASEKPVLTLLPVQSLGGHCLAQDEQERPRNGSRR